ncbi:hypothetical protein LV779_39010 [Streptomyces thinghirensis]|nr:hypothetical protein [Streptomyces thinghirensis]
MPYSPRRPDAAVRPRRPRPPPDDDGRSSYDGGATWDSVTWRGRHAGLVQLGHGGRRRRNGGPAVYEAGAVTHATRFARALHRGLAQRAEGRPDHAPTSPRGARAVLPGGAGTTDGAAAARGVLAPTVPTTPYGCRTTSGFPLGAGDFTASLWSGLGDDGSALLWIWGRHHAAPRWLRGRRQQRPRPGTDHHARGRGGTALGVGCAPTAPTTTAAGTTSRCG